MLVADLVGPSRSSTIVAPRAVALHLLRVEGRLTTDEVGRLTGRAGGTVQNLTRWVRRELQRGASLTELAVRVRKRPSGPQPSAWSHQGDLLLTGLAACRRAAGLTQDQLASAAGLERGTICRIERLHRRARAGTARALAAALGVPPAALAPRAPDPRVARS